jgi:hypothetical protein
LFAVTLLSAVDVPVTLVRVLLVITRGDTRTESIIVVVPVIPISVLEASVGA